MVAEEIIIRPIITEKSAAAQAEGKYTFEVKVADVKTVNVKGKPKRQGFHVGKTSDWKKAIVTIDTNADSYKYLGKGGKVQTVSKKYKTSIEEFGA